ncbi:MAG: DUF4328 domain-containing protein [Actinomycetota bacterium]|nr:DUF4328 domain-containing protein [Actinomycetota bacterium]
MVTPTILNCEVCGRPYKTERGLRAHLASVHDIADSPAVEKVAPPEVAGTPWMAPPMEAAPPPPAPPPPLAPPPPPPPPPRLPPFRSLRDLSSLIGLMFLLDVLFLIIAAAANIFLGATVPPSAGLADLFSKIDKHQWIAWAAAGGFAAAAYVVIVVWLYRAYKNQLSLGARETRLPPSIVVIMCFIPVLNVVFITLAGREIWRNADLQRNEWGTTARPSRVPGLLNVLWIGPVLAFVAWVVFALVISNRVGSQGVTNVDDARVLYVSRCVLLFVLFSITLGLRRVFGALTEHQQRAQWHYQMGRAPS